MFLLDVLIKILLFIVSSLTSIYSLIVLVYCIISWVNADPYNPIVRILRTLTEPALWRIRKYLPFTYGKGMDFSPIVLLIAVQAAGIFLTEVLLHLQQLLR